MIPNPNEIFPQKDNEDMTLVRPTITRPNIQVGEYTYFSGRDFESHVTHHYPVYGDRLIIGRFCQIAAGVEFIMNGANHQMNALSTYPFYILGWEQNPPDMADLPNKGDTVVGNDVWIGQNVTILPGTRIGDGAVIGAESVVSGVVEPYTIVAGNPARLIRRRFDQELQTLLEALRWWDRPAEEIEKLIPLLTCGDLERVRRELREFLQVPKESDILDKTIS